MDNKVNIDKLEDLLEQKKEIEKILFGIETALKKNPKDIEAKEDYISMHKRLSEVNEDLKLYEVYNRNKDLMDMFDKYDRGEIKAKKWED